MAKYGPMDLNEHRHLDVVYGVCIAKETIYFSVMSDEWRKVNCANEHHVR